MRRRENPRHASLLTLSFLLIVFGVTNCAHPLHRDVVLSTVTLPFATITPMQASPTAMSTFTAIPALGLTPTQIALSGYLFSSAIEDPLLAEAIQTALPERIGTVGFGGHSFCSYALLMPLQTTIEGEIHAYLQVLCVEFYVKDRVLQEGSGTSEPVALTLRRQAETWHVIELRTPELGNWGPSIRKIFPPEALPLIFGSTWDDILRQNAVGKILYQDNVRQATAFFGLPFVPTPARGW